MGPKTIQKVTPSLSSPGTIHVGGSTSQLSRYPVGDKVGSAETGAVVGPIVGETLGSIVGDCVGWAVGKAEGELVGHGPHMPLSRASGTSSTYLKQ